MQDIYLNIFIVRNLYSWISNIKYILKKEHNNVISENSINLPIMVLNIEILNKSSYIFCLEI